MKKLSSLTIFFPFLNDEGTVAKAIDEAYRVGKTVANELEIIAIHGGASSDKTLDEIKKAKKKHPSLMIVDKSDNKEGYAVIKEGFAKASKDWVFYTDGDLQYHLDELPHLVEMQQQTGADVVNGYKTTREDNLGRVFAGNIYKLYANVLFHLPIRDITCDFRLIRRSFLSKIALNAKNASLLPELIKKLQLAGAKFAQVPVSHYSRSYGKSNLKVFNLARQRFFGDFDVWIKLRGK